MDNKYFNCIKDGIVIGTITKNFYHITWENFVNILKSSENNKIIESNMIIQKGFTYDGTNFYLNKSYHKNKIEVKNVNGYNIYYYSTDLGSIITDYTNYIISLIQEYIENNNTNNDNKLNILINTNEQIITNLDSIKIGINTEQMIISDDTINYKMNTTLHDYFNDMDIVIDYSNPNINIVNKSFQISNKIYYISPAVYKSVIEIEKNIKIIDTITTFCDIYETENRRLKFLSDLNLPSHINLNDCFDFDKLKNYLTSSKIIINIHRSYYQHTLEELRVLPALMCRVIVISEMSPFIDLIPYKDLIILCDYESIVSKTKEVLENYDYYYDKIFNENNIKLLNNLNNENKYTINNLFKNIL